MTQVFLDNMFAVFFVYGLAFFLMGWSIMIKSPRKLDYFTQGLKLLAYFGLLHGAVEWLDMYQAVKEHSFDPLGFIVYEYLNLFAMGMSFYYLLCCGLHLSSPHRLKWAKVALILCLGGTVAEWDAVGIRNIKISINLRCSVLKVAATSWQPLLWTQSKRPASGRPT